MLCEAYGPVLPEECILQGGQVYYAFFGLTILATLWVLLRLYRDRAHLRISMGLLIITGRPLHSMAQFLAYPIFHLLSGFCVLAGLITIYIFTLGLQSITSHTDTSMPGGASRTLSFDWSQELLFVFICCMCAVWLFFLSSLYRFVMSFAVATWYFCREKSQLYVKVT